MITPAPVSHAGDSSDAARSRGGRLGFLDAARGVAALVVALQHTAEAVWPSVLAWSHTWFRPGEFGVLLFFLCSGFIIPASLERRGSLSEFWIGRFFRLWPLYLSTLAAASVAFLTLPWLNLAGGTSPLLTLAVNMTMLQVFSQVPLIIGASWTLGYELVFYLLVTGLFVMGWHRRSSTLAGVMLTGALVVGSTIPAFLLSRPSPRSVAVAGGLTALALIGVLTSTTRSTRQKLLAAAFIGSAVLIATNRPHDTFFPLLLLGTMFVGTVCYRWTTGELSGRAAAATYLGSALTVALVLRVHHVGYVEPVTGARPQWWTEAATFLGAYLVFATLLLLRRHRFPRWLVYLGTISYSVYLLHALVLLVVPAVGQPWQAFVVWNVLTVAGAAVSYRFVERPAITAGRWVVAARRQSVDQGSEVPDRGRPPRPLVEASPTSAAHPRGVSGS